MGGEGNKFMKNWKNEQSFQILHSGHVSERETYEWEGGGRVTKCTTYSITVS